RFSRDWSSDVCSSDLLIFLVVLVRMLKEQDLPFKDVLKKNSVRLKIAIDEIRSAGSWKHKHHKEAAVFRVLLDKPSYFRKDYSLDLKRARNTIATHLH